MNTQHVPQHEPRTCPRTFIPDMFQCVCPKHVPQHGLRTRPRTFIPDMFQCMCPEHLPQHGLSTHADHMGVQFRSRLAQHWCALLSEKDHCSCAWPAAVIGQSRPTLTILLFMTCATSHSRIDEAFPSNSFHEGWHHVT